MPLWVWALLGGGGLLALSGSASSVPSYASQPVPYAPPYARPSPHPSPAQETGAPSHASVDAAVHVALMRETDPNALHSFASALATLGYALEASELVNKIATMNLHA